MIPRLVLALLGLLLAGCASMADLRPGDGHAITIAMGASMAISGMPR